MVKDPSGTQCFALRVPEKTPDGQNWPADGSPSLAA